MLRLIGYFFFFFFNDTATTEIYTLSLHDALPISRAFLRKSPPRQFLRSARDFLFRQKMPSPLPHRPHSESIRDRKSTRLNSSHSQISYAVFCLKKKKKTPITQLYKYAYPKLHDAT